METKEAIEWMKDRIEEDGERSGLDQQSKAYIFKLFKFTENRASESFTLRESRHKAELETNLEVFRSVFTYGQAALRTTITINGGAAIAILAFLARYVGSPSLNVDISKFSTSLLIFGIGVFIGAFTTGLTYLTQYFYSNEQNKLGVTFQSLSLFLGICSIMCFGVGIWLSYLGFLPAINV